MIFSITLVQFSCIEMIQFFVNDSMKNSMERISRIFKKKMYVVKMKESSKWQKNDWFSICI